MANFHDQKWYFFPTNCLIEVQSIEKLKNHIENYAGTVFFEVLSYKTGPSIICIWNFIEPIW